jgi:hypothetical protein
MDTSETIREGLIKRLEYDANCLPQKSGWVADELIDFLSKNGIVQLDEGELPYQLTASWVNWNEEEILSVAIWDTQEALEKAGYRKVKEIG